MQFSARCKAMYSGVCPAQNTALILDVARRLREHASGQHAIAARVKVVMS
jgi:hypothetical protein